MDLADSGDCLKVYDSDSADQYQVAAEFCGTRPVLTAPTPTSLVLHSGKALLVWTTGSSNSGSGWSVAWSFTDAVADGRSAICGGDALTGTTGRLVNSMDDGPTNYYHGTACRRAIVGPVGSVVQLKVNKYDVPTTQSGGVVTLCRGANTRAACRTSDTATFLVALNSYGRKPKVGAVEVLPTNAVVVEWVVPDGVSYATLSGWELEWSFVSSTVNICEGDERTLTAASGVIIDDASTSGLYAGSVNGCDKVIAAPAGKEIRLEFGRLGLADSSDCLKVYDSDSADQYQVAAEFCGTRPVSTAPTPTSLVLHSGKALLVWTTGSSNSGSGWSVAWSFTDAVADGRSAICGGDALTGTTGRLVNSMDDGPTNYYHGTACRRAIVGPVGSVVQLKVNKYDVPTTQSGGVVTLCRGANTRAACRTSDTATFLVALNSYGRKPKVGAVEVLPTNAVVVEWVVPDGVSYATLSGWELEWSFVSSTVNICEGDERTLTAASGVIIDDASTSGLYAGSVNGCDKVIAAPAGKEIRLEFGRLGLADSSDCLKVYDSDSADQYQVAAEFCGTRPVSTAPTPTSLVLHSGKALLVWTTGSSNSGSGWSVAWSFTDAVADGRSAICGGGALSSNRGRLVESKNGGPLQFYHGTVCRRAIVGPVGSTVDLKVNKFDVSTTQNGGRVSLCRGSDTGVLCRTNDPAFLVDLNSYGNKPSIGQVSGIPTNAVVVQWAVPNGASYAMDYGWELEWSFDPPWPDDATTTTTATTTATTTTTTTTATVDISSPPTGTVTTTTTTTATNETTTTAVATTTASTTTHTATSITQAVFARTTSSSFTAYSTTATARTLPKTSSSFTSTTTRTNTRTTTKTRTSTTTTEYNPDAVNCEEIQDSCTRKCQSLSERNYTVITERVAPGRVCKGPSDCKPGEDACQPTTTTSATTFTATTTETRTSQINTTETSIAAKPTSTAATLTSTLGDFSGNDDNNVDDISDVSNQGDGIDPCSVILCAKICTDDCGWSLSRGVCVTGLSTETHELGEGNCTFSAQQRRSHRRRHNHLWLWVGISCGVVFAVVLVGVYCLCGQSICKRGGRYNQFSGNAASITTTINSAYAFPPADPAPRSTWQPPEDEITLVLDEDESRWKSTYTI
jgi:hypothetical protein